ncbi:MAG: creatininase family protein, partial [Limnohabitans sp.]
MAQTSHFWADLSTVDIAQLDRARTIAVLPVAATEQHGPHLPLSVDTDLVNGVLQASLAHLPADLPAFFLPTQPRGNSPQQAPVAGTRTHKPVTNFRRWTDHAES